MNLPPPLPLLAIAAMMRMGCRDITTGVDPRNHGGAPVGGIPPVVAAAPVRVDPATRVRLTDLYDRIPDLADCDEGSLKMSEKMKAVDYVNAIRRLHGLAPVIYRSDDDRAVAESALIMAANNVLTHEPSSNLSCWTREGAEASEESNLAIMSFTGTGQELATTEQMIDMFWKDTLVEDLGHRRWLLDPFLKFVSFGRVDRPASAGGLGVTAATMRIVYPERQDVSGSSVDYVAYPYRDYPAELYNGDLMMSFSVVADRRVFRNNVNVDFRGARVEIVGQKGERVPVAGMLHDNLAYGLPNCLYWRADVRPGIRYAVRVSGVRVAGDVKSYEYWFTLHPSA